MKTKVFTYLSIFMICASLLMMNCYAARITADLIVPTGLDDGYATMVPSAGAGTWSVGVEGASNTSLNRVVLRFTTDSGIPVTVGTLQEIDIGRQKSLSHIVFNSVEYTVYAKADSTAGVVASTTINS